MNKFFKNNYICHFFLLLHVLINQFFLKKIIILKLMKNLSGDKDINKIIENKLNLIKKVNNQTKKINIILIINSIKKKKIISKDSKEIH